MVKVLFELFYFFREPEFQSSSLKPAPFPCQIIFHCPFSDLVSDLVFKATLGLVTKTQSHSSLDLLRFAYLHELKSHT